MSESETEMPVVSAMRKLIHHRPQYVKDAVRDTASRWQVMADNGAPGYRDSARRLRFLATEIQVPETSAGAGALERDEPTQEDYLAIIEAVLFYEINKANAGA